ncbi:MAG: pallilysin-related adhesin [Spirochaetaceae bacterium]|jgi:hypothetical protein|nr:pallilysin-related adhesin [Spirochaetaceae bacterium]
MIARTFRLITFVAFTLALFVIAGLLVLPRLPFAEKETEARQSRIIVPLAPVSGEVYPAGGSAERMAYEDDVLSKIALKEGESLVSVLTQNFDGDPLDEQIVAYRRPSEIDGPIYIIYVDFDDELGGYRRVWDFPTPITRQGTLNLYTLDMIGDRSICLAVMGMNNAGEQTLTVLQKKTATPRTARNVSEEPFRIIAEIQVDGSIGIREIERTTAYQLGYTRGEPFTITAYGRDHDSSNLMDQIETVYAYNQTSALYERQRTVRIPGAQIEQRLLRELLSGSAAKFEDFIDGLWYHVNNDGTLDQRQYIYFDPANREIIFFGDEMQQVFSWRNSTPTRYGLYISSQNVSVVTLTRFLEVDLESLEAIRLRVVEDVRIKIGVSDPWNGSYRKAGTAELRRENNMASLESHPYIDSVYSGYIGAMTFTLTGDYSLDSGNSVQKGRYAFFMLGDTELLELRPESGTERIVYRVNWGKTTGGGQGTSGNGQGAGGQGTTEQQGDPSQDRLLPAELTLVRVRLSTRGIQELHEAAISMTLNPEA